MLKTNFRCVDFNLLVVLRALYDEQSLARIAEGLAITQTSVSGMLKRLRVVVDDELFLRTSHGIVPPPRSDALIAAVKDIITTVQSLLLKDDFDPETAEFPVAVCGNEYTLNTALCRPSRAKCCNARRVRRDH